MSDNYYTASDVALLLDVSANSVRQMLVAGAIPSATKHPTGNGRWMIPLNFKIDVGYAFGQKKDQQHYTIQNMIKRIPKERIL